MIFLISTLYKMPSNVITSHLTVRPTGTLQTDTLYALYMNGNTIDLGGALIQANAGNVFISNLDVEKITGNGRGLTGLAIPPSISSVQITDSNWNPINDLALSTISTGYFLIQGNNFEANSTVYVGSTVVASVAVISQSILRVSVNPRATGSYDLTVQTVAGSGTRVNAINFDPIPVWSTGSNLGNVSYGASFSINLSAIESGGSTIVYSNVSILPPNTTLHGNGQFTGTNTTATSTSYNFTMKAIDEELQSSLRSFTMTFYRFIASGASQTTSNGSKTVYLFTSDSTLTVTSGAYIRFLSVGGGGGGGAAEANFDGGEGGGGGGGAVVDSYMYLSPGTYNVFVGAGSLNNGGSSYIDGIATTLALGGGQGADEQSTNAGSLGTGGGGGGDGITAGTGSQGGNGGSGGGRNGGGGGGAGGNGSPGNTNYGGNGGIGISSNITGTPTYYGGGGGGGGGSNVVGARPGTGGSGGGGNGGQAGVDGLGGGGGGSYQSVGRVYSGGDGIFVISTV